MSLTVMLDPSTTRKSIRALSRMLPVRQGGGSVHYLSEGTIMSKHYKAAGILVLDRVTPIIRALFGAFNLSADPDHGRAHIAQTCITNIPNWCNIHDKLFELASGLGIALDQEADTATLLRAYARHFRVEQDEELKNLIEQRVFDGAIDLEFLFVIASRFDDGHRLSALLFEELRSFDWGTGASNIDHALELRKELRRAAFDEAAALIALEAIRLLRCIQDAQAREAVQRKLVEYLSPNVEKSAKNA